MMQLNLRLCLYAMRCTIWYYLRNLKKREKHPWRAVTFSKVEACNFTQSNNPSLVLCFSNRTNGTESRKASHMILRNHSLSYRTKKGTKEKKMKSFVKRIKKLTACGFERI